MKPASRRVCWGFALLLVVACTADRQGPGDGKEGVASAPAAAPLFTDISTSAGLSFSHFNAASAAKLLPETMGSGVAFFDYDGDDRPDLFAVNGADVADPSSSPPAALYRNLGNGTFEDVTVSAGLAAPFAGMGAAVGDLDNDGDLDLFLTGIDGDRLYVNVGDGTFTDETRSAGLDDRGFGSSAAFLDYDRDGLLDLYVGRYVEWSPETDVRCSPDGKRRTYCTPEVYSGQSNRLYRNLGGVRFADVTHRAGVYHDGGKTLGVVVFDHDRDGWPDLAVANDTAPNFLFVNHWDGTFRELAIASGLAYSPSGAPRGAMGIDVGDLDGDGIDDVVIGNFSQEMSAVYRGLEPGLYADEGPQLGIGLPTLMTLAFGTLVVDLDLDGRLDVSFANGHIEPEIGEFQSFLSYAQPLHIFLNRGSSLGQMEFELVEEPMPSPLARPWVGRGLATADIDGDGDLDLALSQNGRPLRLLRNETPPRSWLRLQLIGRRSPRTPYGATVVAVAGERRIQRTLASGRSYLSASEPILTFGLGEIERLDRLEIRWPSGILQTVPEPATRQLLKIEEPEAQASSPPRDASTTP